MVLLQAVVSILALGLYGVQADTIDCYAYNGETYSNNTKCPGSNACCDSQAICLSNRLCHNPDDDDTTFIRGPCAVEDFGSGTCAQICLYDEEGLFPRVRVCDDGSLCCDNDSQCCSNNNGIFLDNNGNVTDSAPSTTYSYGPERTAATFSITQTVSTTSTSTSTTQGTTPTSTPAQETGSADQDSSDTTDSDDGGDDDQAMKIGVGVGVPVGVIALAGLAFLFWRRHKATKKSNVAEVPGSYAGEPKPPGQYYYGAPPSSTGPYSTSTQSPMQAQQRVELDGVPRQYSELSA